MKILHEAVDNTHANPTYAENITAESKVLCNSDWSIVTSEWPIDLKKYKNFTPEKHTAKRIDKIPDLSYSKLDTEGYKLKDLSFFKKNNDGSVSISIRNDVKSESDFDQKVRGNLCVKPKSSSNQVIFTINAAAANAGTSGKKTQLLVTGQYAETLKVGDQVLCKDRLDKCEIVSTQSQNIKITPKGKIQTMSNDRIDSPSVHKITEVKPATGDSLKFTLDNGKASFVLKKYGYVYILSDVAANLIRNRK